MSSSQILRASLSELFSCMYLRQLSLMPRKKIFLSHTTKQGFF